MTAEFGTFPIDTTKTRLQLQGQVIDAKQKEIRYRGMLHAFVRISREDGIKALYNGVAPALLRQATYGSLKLGFYHALKRRLVKNPKDETLFYNVIAGVVAGAFSSAICNPTDLLKIRMQAEYQSGVNVRRKECFDRLLQYLKKRGSGDSIGELVPQLKEQQLFQELNFQSTIGVKRKFWILRLWVTTLTLIFVQVELLD